MLNRFLWMLLLVLPMHSFAQSPGAVATVDAYLQRKLDSLYKDDPSISIYVGVMRHGEMTFKGVGYADTAQKIPFDANTLFEVGSITKTLTAFVLTAVLAEKHIDVRSKILPYLPEAVTANSSLAGITFENLMNHTSGLPRMPSNFLAKVTNVLQPYENYTYDDLFAALAAVKISGKQKVEYSNLGFALCGYLAEKISQSTYNMLVQKYVLSPSGIQLKSPERERYPRATGYFNNGAAEWWRMGPFAPAGAMVLNAREVLQYVKAMSAPPTPEFKGIAEKVTTVTTTMNDKIKVCQGWHTFEAQPATIYWHNGGTYGFSTYCAFTKGTSDGVVVVVNKFNKNEISDGLGLSVMLKLAE